MAKKLMVAVIGVVFLGIASLFYVNSMIDKEIKSVLSNNSNFTVTKEELRKNVGNAVGYFEAKITKEELEEKFSLYIKDLAKLGIPQTEIETVVSEIKNGEVIKYDLDFRCDYELNYSPLSFKNGFEMDANITILTPEYASHLKEVFGTHTPFKVYLEDSLNEMKFRVNLADIDVMNEYDNLQFAGFEIAGVQTNDEKIKRVDIKFKDLISKDENFTATIKDFDFSINFKNGVVKDITKILDDSFTSKVAVTLIDTDLAKLEDLNVAADVKSDGGILTYKTAMDIKTVSSFEVELKNIKYQDELEIDKKLYEFYSYKFFTLLEEDEKMALDGLKENFGKGFKYNMKEFSLENLDGNLASLNLNMELRDINGSFEDIVKFATYKGKFSISPNFAEFLMPYGGYAFFGAMIDSYEGLKKEDNKTYLEFEGKNGEFLLNGEVVENPLLSMIQATDSQNSYDNESFKSMEELADDLEILVDDLSNYYMIFGKSSDEGIYNYMTDIKVLDATKNSAYFLVFDRRCVEVHLNEKGFVLVPSYDANDEICKEFYEIPKVDSIIKNGEFRFDAL